MPHNTTRVHGAWLSFLVLLPREREYCTHYFCSGKVPAEIREDIQMSAESWL
jgi:hypothetical protein